jgi:hypothetical protein
MPLSIIPNTPYKKYRIYRIEYIEYLCVFADIKLLLARAKFALGK